jgi:glycosyltransferase involved in cell wall biosynthesis
VRHVAVITTFADLHDAFSLCHVVAEQLEMLLGAGCQVSFVATEGCVGRGVFAHPSLRQLRLPGALLRNETDAVDRPAAFRSDVDYLKGKLRPALATCDVAITHDIVYLWHYLAYNVACRELALEFPRVRWLHWIHSAPVPHQALPAGDPRAARFRPFPHGTFVYPNAADVPRVARQFAVPTNAVRVVPHSVDLPRVWDFHPVARALVERLDLCAPDVLAIYPVRLYRLKQAEKAVRLFAELKRAGASVCLLILNSQSTGDDFVCYRNEVSAEAASLGLASSEVVFSNTLVELPGVPAEVVRQCYYEVPHRVVMDLFRLTNVYVHPSASETYSLVCQEAAAAGNLLVLNEDVPAMRDVYGEGAVYARFSSTQFRTTYQPSEQAYYAEVARAILDHLACTPTLAQRTRVRQTRNPKAVFNQYVGPLLEDHGTGAQMTAS